MEPYVLIINEVDSSDRNLVHFSRWTSIASARAFFESAELVEIRRAAGVHPPTFLYLESVESAAL